MGRSTGYCFKIITCVGSSESVDRDDLDASSENKGSDKRGWSFRKRSAGHQVQSNTVITEIPSENKSLEYVMIHSEAPIGSSVSEKTTANQWTEEMPHESSSTNKGDTKSNLETKAAADEDNIKFDSSPDESSVIVIQANVRKFLAQRELLRLKKVVKLQAAIRGHLVRCQAAGTLRCIQAIVKMQSLVRARHANVTVKRSSIGKKVMQDSKSKAHPTYVSIDKLLSNRFATQLLESTPRTKQINIKCDPLKYDSSWKWLERWMSASSPEDVDSDAPKQEQDKADDNKTKIGNMIIPHESTLTEIKSDVQSAPPFLSEETEKSEPANTILTDSKQKSDVLSDEAWLLKTEKPKRPAKRGPTEQADSDGRKSGFGLRKASNPSFVAAQSKFEELTNKNNIVKSVSSSNKEQADNSLSVETSNQKRHIEPAESLVYESLRVGQTGGSECGTELSVTSMLDSPDPSEIGNIEYEKEDKVLDNKAGDIKKSVNVEDHALLGTELTHSISILSEKYADNAGEGSEHLKNSLEENTNTSCEDIELEPETGRQVHKSNVDKKLESEIHHQMEKPSPEASPRSHVTVPESQGTPSSQISNTNKARIDRKVSSQKPKSRSNSKKSLVLRSSLEHLPSDPKPGERRKSFGSQTSDQIDQDPRDSSSSNSIPSYMQVTESAKAKALANNSPRSSPDMQGKEAYLKKRHSLPGGVNGRHGSPRMKRSSPQAQQATKGTDNRERKWQR